MGQFIENFLLQSHTIAGALTLIAGIMAMIAQPKGAKLHKLFGRIFYYAMLWIFLSACLLLLFYRFRIFLLVIAIFSFYMSFSGKRVTKRKRAGSENELDRAASMIAMLAGAVLAAYGAWGMVTKGFGIAFLLSLIFGLMTFLTGYSDWQSMRATYRRDSKMWWWYRHMGRMLGSFIAGFTAMLVVNGNHWFGAQNWLWTLWLLPTLVGTPLIGLWVNQYRRKFRDQ